MRVRVWQVLHPWIPILSDIAYWGYAPPLAIEDSFVGGVNTYYATYGTFGPGTQLAAGEVL